MIEFPFFHLEILREEFYEHGNQIRVSFDLLAVMVAGCLNASSTKPDWVHDVNWIGEKPDAIVENELWTQISPYHIEYDHLNITAKNEKDGLHLRVIGISNGGNKS